MLLTFWINRTLGRFKITRMVMVRENMDMLQFGCFDANINRLLIPRYSRWVTYHHASKGTTETEVVRCNSEWSLVSGNLVLDTPAKSIVLFCTDFDYSTFDQLYTSCASLSENADIHRKFDWDWRFVSGLAFKRDVIINDNNSHWNQLFSTCEDKH